MSTALSKVSRGDLVKYDPRKGVKRIAALEMAEKHFAKAKDASQLEQAIRAKLQAQAEFVLWWDTHGPGVNHGGRRKRSRRHQDDRSVILNSAAAVAERLGTSVKAISRWRRRLSASPEEFEEACQQATLRYAQILEFDPHGTRGLGLSLAENWYTPDRYLEAARKVLGGIDLDPASSTAANKRVKATTFFSAADDGVTKDWPGRVWLNPPYVGETGRFVARLVAQYRAGITTAAVLLVNANSTDTGWFQPLWDFILCFTDHRINFIAGNNQEQNGSNHGSAFVYLGPRRDDFIETFDQFGAVVERASRR